jgi:hypothetical protein
MSKNRTRKHKKGGSLTGLGAVTVLGKAAALGKAALLGKAKGLSIGLKNSLKHLGHVGHSVKHNIAAMDDVVIAYAKTRKHGKDRKHNKKSKKSKKEALLDLPQSLDVNEIHHTIKGYGGKLSRA